jgi:ABC-type spermidine/putrescine transport system permease subunit I
MTKRARSGKLYPLFTILRDMLSIASGGWRQKWNSAMVAIAATMFMALFGFGSTYFGWSDPEGKVRLALFATFTLGIICGYKTQS